MFYRVTIIATGQELLNGTTTDTNSAFMSSSFWGTNFRVINHVTVGDDYEELKTTLLYYLDKSDIVITTGGLGPTSDDNTVEVICEILGEGEKVHEKSHEKMVDRFNRMGRGTYPTDRKMVSVPESSLVLENEHGISPGFIVKSGEKIIASLPGVPSEMKVMFQDRFLPYLKKNFSFSEDLKLSYTVSGVTESEINRRILLMGLPESVSWGVSAKSSHSELTFLSDDVEFKYKSYIDERVRADFASELLHENYKSVEEEVVSLLEDRSLTIGSAESCTGGLIGKRITDIAGSSGVYLGSVIAYANNIKSELLSVDESTILTKGAVSEEVALMMARGVQKRLGCDVALSTTGVAGPGGGSAEKPVGTVYVGIIVGDDTEVHRFQLAGNRFHIRESTVTGIFNIVRKKLLELK